MNKIKILLYDLKLQNKEFQEILNNLFVFDEKKLFKEIFSINSYTNTDMYNFLTIYEMYNHKDNEILKKIVGLKFFQGEKDTDQVILKYFQVLTKDLNKDISFPLYERFIILLNSPLFSNAINNEIFKYFQIFLFKYPDFFDRAIFNLKDNTLKYRLLIDSVDIKYVFIIPNVTLLLLENTKSKYLLQEFFDIIPTWYFRSLSDDLLSFLYNNFDKSEFYKDVCFLFIKQLSVTEILEEFKKDKHIRSTYDKDNRTIYDKDNRAIYDKDNRAVYDKDIRTIYDNDSRAKYDKDSRAKYDKNTNEECNKYISEECNKHISEKCDKNISEECNKHISKTCDKDICEAYDKDIYKTCDNDLQTNINIRINEKGKIISTLPISLIEKFNTTMDISGLYYKYKKMTWVILRYHHLTNLKILGEFLCNHKNINYLMEFTDTFDFTDMDILVALRLYLNGFFLVGESQIIHRVLEIFSNHFVKFNNFDSGFILNLSFSLLLLNTKMYNSNIKTKPSFEEYISDFDAKEIPDNISMLELYNSIKTCKINIPDKNETNLSHYEIYTRMLTDLHIEDKMENNIGHDSKFSISIYLMDKYLVFSDSILNTSHDKFLELCKYSSMEYLPLYLRYNKSDTYRFLNIFKYYLSYKGDIEIYRLFVKLKTKKYKGLINDIIVKKIPKENCEILEEIYKESKNEIIISMIENNLNSINDINIFDYDTQFYFMNKKCITSLIKKSQFSVKLLRDLLTNNSKLITKEIINLFKEIDDSSEDSFFTMISIQKEEDMFDYAIKIDINDNIYRFTEKYNIEDNIKLFHFYSTSKFILNQSILKKLIASDQCIRKSDLVKPSNLDKRLIYLILKCDNLENKELVNYTLWIINLLCTSLPIFIDFFNRNILLLKGPLQNSITKIFISRIKKVVSGLTLCCECQYNKLTTIDIFISKMVENNMFNIKDIEFWYTWKKEMSKNNKIIQEDNEYILNNK